MSTEITKPIQEIQFDEKTQQIISQVVATGDLKGLTPAQKTQYIIMTCQSQGLNPLLAAHYYEIIVFQKKEVLYAKKGLAEALRDSRKINCRVLSSQLDKDLGLYSVKAVATLPNGRSEESLAVLPIEVEEVEWKRKPDGTSYPAKTGNMIPARGQELANLMMKCETKAKRRATLALCGLGIEERNFETDNVYDVDDIPERYATRGVDPTVTTYEPWLEDTVEPITQESKVINDSQRKRLFALCKDGNNNSPLPRWTDEQIKDYLLSVGYTSSKDILQSDYEKICEYFQSHAGHWVDDKGQIKIDESPLPSISELNESLKAETTPF